MKSLSLRLESVERNDRTEWLFRPSQAIQVGRHRDNDVVISHGRVSRFHLTLFCDGRDWHCASFGSSGTHVNGKSIAHILIRSGVVLKLGSSGPRLHCELVEPRAEDLADVNDDAAMSLEQNGSLTFLIEGVRAGDMQALEELWERCCSTMARIARQRLGIHRRVEDEDDIAAIVFRKIYFAANAGKLPHIADRSSWWRLVTTITRNAVSDSRSRERSSKRGGGYVRGESIADDGKLPVMGPSAFDNFAQQAPTPESIASLNELLQQWLARLPDDETRQVALMRLEGFSMEEIAQQLGLSDRTASRRMQAIRQAWGHA